MKLHKYLQSLGIVTVISVGLLGCSANGQSYSPEQVIQHTLADSKNVTSYYAESVIKSNDGTSDMVMKEWSSESGKRRVEMEMKDTGEKTTTVNDGKSITTYDEATNTAYTFGMEGETPSTQMSPKEQAEMLLDMIKDTHKITLVGEEKLLDRDVYHLKAEAKEKGDLYGDQEIWVDKETWFILKSHSTSADIEVTIEYTKIDFSPTFKDSLFQLDVPEGVKIESYDESIDQTEVQSVDEAAALLQKSFLSVKEENGISIGKMTVISYGEEMSPSLTIEYLKDNLPYFTLDIFPIDESIETNIESADQGNEDIRGMKGEKLDMEGYRSLNWVEEGISYSVTLLNPDLTFEEMKGILEEM